MRDLCSAKGRLSPVQKLIHTEEREGDPRRPPGRAGSAPVYK